MTTLVGKTLANRYRLDEFIGRGGMADVYKAWDSHRNTYLAVKVLQADLALDKVFMRRFEREGQLLAHLQHPNIVRYYGLERADNLAFLLLDYVDGVSLKQLIGESLGPLPGNRARSVFQAVCVALQFAHNEGLVHCDIKPANILIDTKGRVLLSDFGIARLSSDPTSTLAGSGSPAYMAPEQINQQNALPQTDIYALGVVLYEMLTAGERPFTGERAQITGSTVQKVTWEHLNLPPIPPTTFNPDIPPALENVVMRCLQKDPTRRYASALDFLNALIAALPSKTVRRTIQEDDLPTYDYLDNAAHSTETAAETTQQGVPAWAKIVGGVIGVGIVGVLCIGALFLGYNYLSSNAATSTPVAQQPLPTTTVSPSPTSTPQEPDETILPTATPNLLPVTPTPDTRLYNPLPDCSPSRLYIGDSAFVALSGGRNAIRSEPDTHPSDNIEGYAYQGEALQITAGPVCNYGWVLWEVRSPNGIVGWTPETDGETFWLDPIETTQACPGAPVSRLAIGGLAYVAQEPPVANTVRSEPHKSAADIGQIEPGERVQILDGPQCADDLTWWQVQSMRTSLTGWTVEGDFDSYWLIPEPANPQ
ncbi:MAG: protein kinase [Anaerolineales bacterium]|nr:protein kinase [Anaerolineales bacterium]